MDGTVRYGPIRPLDQQHDDDDAPAKFAEYVSSLAMQRMQLFIDDTW